MLCRNDNDCLWIDNGLRCTDYKLDWTMTSEWFNGDTSAIVGTCDCVTAQWWSDDHLQCLVTTSNTNMCLYIDLYFVSGLFFAVRNFNILHSDCSNCRLLHFLLFVFPIMQMSQTEMRDDFIHFWFFVFSHKSDFCTWLLS